MRRAAWIAAAGVLGLVLAACGGGGDDGPDSETPEQPPPPPSLPSDGTPPVPSTTG